jgi:ankyrin repeat protein
MMYQNMRTNEQDDLKKIYRDATFKGDVDSLKECIRKGINCEVETYGGSNALIDASMIGYLDIIEYLTKECKFDVEKSDCFGRTALHFASDFGRLEIVKYLIEVCHANFESNMNGWTALHHASYGSYHPFRSLEVVRYLTVECNANVEAKDNQGVTALHRACGRGSWHIVQYLIEDCHANVETQGDNGYTALHFAIVNGKMSVVQYLIGKCHADMFVMTNNGENVFDLARKTRSQTDFIVYLLQAFQTKRSDT